MGFYIDITLLPNPEVSSGFLWRKVYQQVHIGLVGMMNGSKKSDIGVSFPEYESDKLTEADIPIGRKLRLYSKRKDQLASLNIENLLNRLSDYVHLTSIREAPLKLKGYQRFKRVQSKSNTERLARRKAKREGIDYDKALTLLKSRKNIFKKVPFINLPSVSTGQNFPLLIAREVAEGEVNDGYNAYGLSSTSTIPMF